MQDILKIYQKLKYYKSINTERYKAFVDVNGKCCECGTDSQTSSELYNGGYKVYCSSCFRIIKDCDRLGMNRATYDTERAAIITEIIGRVENKKRKQPNTGHTKNIRRNVQIYQLFLLGRSHAHIAGMMGLSRERVRQVISNLKK